jgi:hypothetical protein
LRSRSIDNYLSAEEKEQITFFIQKSIERFEKYDGRIRMTPKRYNSDELQKIYIEKYNLWEKAVNNKVPDTSSTYIDLFRQNDSNPCPVEQFLKALMQIIQQAIPPRKYENILDKLETNLVKCKFTCPCPAEPTT